MKDRPVLLAYDGELVRLGASAAGDERAGVPVCGRIAEPQRRIQEGTVALHEGHPGDGVRRQLALSLVSDSEAALGKLLAHDTGVFVAPPGVGKTVVGTALVAARKCSTLVLVHRMPLLDQWRAQLALFLGLDPREVGQIGGGKQRANGVLDVAMLQTLVRAEGVDGRVAEYGQVIVDECHHLPAFSFERVLAEAKARYIVGLTATLRRRDGHHPITTMQLGPVRFKISAKEQAARRPFEHKLIVRETEFELPDSQQDLRPAQIYDLLVNDDRRNSRILDDVIASIREGRAPIVLTERREHATLLAGQLERHAPNLVVLMGGKGVRQRRAAAARLAALAPDEARVIVATGKFVGEGFDDARLAAHSSEGPPSPCGPCWPAVSSASKSPSRLGLSCGSLNQRRPRSRVLTCRVTHDALFRYVFSQPEHAAGELQAVLPAALSARLDWNSLELLPSSFVDERLGERQADLLFSIGCDGRQSYVYVLLEHQSTSDALMAFRVLRYLVRIWDGFLAEHPKSERLPLILPVVVHHSQQGWRAATDLCSLIDVDAETLALVSVHVPQFQFVLDDLSHAEDEALRNKALTALASAARMLLARGRNTSNLLENLWRWVDVFGQVAGAQNGVAGLVALLEYTFRVGDMRPEDLRKLVAEIGPIAQEAYMTAAQRLTAESYAQGIAEGKAAGKAEGKAAGKAEGKAEGEAKGKAELLLRQMSLRFGALSDATREKVLGAKPEQLDVWAERVLTGANLEEVLG